MPDEDGNRTPIELAKVMSVEPMLASRKPHALKRSNVGTTNYGTSEQNISTASRVTNVHISENHTKIYRTQAEKCCGPTLQMVRYSQVFDKITPTLLVKSATAESMEIDSVT